MCRLAVCGLTNSAPAASSLELPSASRSATCASFRVSLYRSRSTSSVGNSGVSRSSASRIAVPGASRLDA